MRERFRLGWISGAKRRWHEGIGGYTRRRLVERVALPTVALVMVSMSVFLALGHQAAGTVHAQSSQSSQSSCTYNPLIRPTLLVDKSESTLFQPGQTITIYGSGYRCNAQLTVLVTPAGLTSTPSPIQLTTDATGTFNTTYTIPLGSNASPYPIDVQVYDAYAVLQTDLTLHSCQDKGSNLFTSIPGCGPETLLQDSSNYAELQPLEQQAEQEIATLRNVANDTTNVYFSRGEIRAQMLVDLLTMLNNCQGGTDNGTCSSIDENIIGSYSMAVRQQRVDIAKLADELYEGSGMFCIPGTTSCGWQSWESNQCSFLVPLGQGAQSGPNAQDTDQLAYQQRKDTQSACGGLGNTVAPQPSYDDFTSWAAAAVLGAQLQKWAASLQKYNSVISGTNPWDEAQQEYIAAGDGFQEGVDFLTVQGAEAPTATASPAAVTDQQSINDLLSSLKVEFGPDVLIDFTKSVVQNIVEELAPTLFSGDIELLGAAETFVPLIIGAALLAAPALAQLTTNSELACQLQNAVTAAQNDNLYDDVHGTASYTYTSINGESCPSGTVTLAPSTGVEMLLNALMVSTMPDFTVLRNKLTPPQFGPVQPSDPVFVRTFQSENFSTNTSVTESTTQSQIDVESWSGTTNDVSIVNGWFNVHGSYQPDLEYQHDTEMYRAWINGSQFVTYRVAIPLGGVIVQGTIEGICPGVPEFGATVDPGLCVIPPGPVSGTLPYETASFHPHTPISPGDQIAIGQMTGDQGSTPAIEHANIRTVQAYASIDPPTFLEEGITIATPLLPDNPSSSSQYYPAAYQLSQPAPTCFTKAGVTGSIECGNDPVLYYQDPDSDVTGSTSSVWLHSVGAADDSFTADSSGQASGTVLGNDAPTAQDQTELLGVDTTNGYAQFSVVAGVSNGQLNLNASTPVAFATTGGFEYTANSGAAANSGGPTCQQFPISGVPSSVYAGYKVCGGPTASAGDSFIYKLCYTVPKFGSLDNPAPTVCTYAQVTIMGIPQTLLFSSPGPKSYGDPAFANPATSNGPGTISYATGSGSVGCTVDSATGLVTITGAAVGSNYCILVATQAGAGGGGYLPAPSVTIQFHIAPALLFVTASHADLSFGGAAPDASSYTYSFSGFAPSDTRASVVGSTAPDCTTNYQQGNGVGTYAISCAIGTLSSPNYTFVSGYNGSDGFSGTNGTALASTPVQLGAFMVNQADTATALSSSPSAPVVGQTVTLTATVSPSPDGGTVTFTENGVALPCGPGSQSLSNGTATCVTTESIAGSHIIKASYSGDTNFHGSSASLTQPVTRASTTTSLTVSSPTQPGGLPVGTAVAVAGQTVTFTATIAVQTPGSGTPTGTVSFYQDDSTTPITCGPGSQAFSNGTATCTVPESGVGHHSITATYNGDSNYSGSSAGLTLYVDTDLSSYLKNGVYNLSNVKLSGGYFVGANLKGANLSNGNFSGANFSDANLSGANLNDGNFSNANFTGAELSGANLGNSNLKGAMLNNVVWSNTTCPDNTNSTKDGGSCMGHL